MSCIPDEIDTPDVLIDRDILDRNIGRMSSAVAAKGIALRPHVKTHKLPEIAYMQLRAGARPDGGHHRGSRGIRRPRRRRRIHHLPIVDRHTPSRPAPSAG